MIWGRASKEALSHKRLPINSRNSVLEQRVGRSGDRGRTRSIRLLPRIDPAGFMRAKMDIIIFTKGH